MRAELRRRSVLAAGAAAVPVAAAGCKGVGALGTPPKPLPQVAVLRAAISAEQLMITGYRSAIAGSPSLAATLAPVLNQHLAHLAALRARLIEPAGTQASPAATGEPASPAATGAGGTAAASPAATGPGGQAATLAALAADEDGAAAALTSRLAVVSPSLAQLLASVAASEASHAALLRAHRSSG